MSVRQTRRKMLRAEANCRFIEAADYLKRLTSHQALLRSDDPLAALRGLLDPATGTRFVVEDEKLHEFSYGKS